MEDDFDREGLVGKFREEDEDELLRRALQTKDGRALVWMMMGVANPIRSSFSSDALEMARAEGQRDLGRILFGKVFTLSPDQYTLMNRESLAREGYYRARADATQDQGEDE